VAFSPAPAAYYFLRFVRHSTPPEYVRALTALIRAGILIATGFSGMNYFVQRGFEREQAMKTEDASRKHAANATRGRLVDFLFVGIGIVPLVLLFGGLPGIAILVFIPLLFAACLCGMWEQVESKPGHSAGDGDHRDGLGGKPPAAGVSLRKRL
jgi:hypothetical protein